MEKRVIIITSIILAIVFISILTYFVINKNTSLSPNSNSNTQTPLENCNTLINNGNPDEKINLVFFSTKEQSQMYYNYLLTISPFSSEENKNSFNVYYITPESYTSQCEIYKNIALLCYNKELIKVASSCPNDYIIVTKDSPLNIRSSSYMNVLSINLNNDESVFAHELGHSLGFLADEYTPATLPSKSKNCANDCKNFLGESEGCFQGCSKTDYFRSIESGIMRTLLSNTYGIFDEQLLSRKILELLNNKKRNTPSTNNEITTTGNVVSSVDNNLVDCNNQEYFLIEGYYNSQDKKITINDKTIETGCLGSSGSGEFSYTLFLNNGETIEGSQGEFNPELIFTDNQLENEKEINGEIYENQGLFMLKLPIIENSESLQIIKDNQEIKRINLQGESERPCRLS